MNQSRTAAKSLPAFNRNEIGVGKQSTCSGNGNGNGMGKSRKRGCRTGKSLRIRLLNASYNWSQPKNGVTRKSGKHQDNRLYQSKKLEEPKLKKTGSQCICYRERSVHEKVEMLAGEWSDSSKAILHLRSEFQNPEFRRHRYLSGVAGTGRPPDPIPYTYVDTCPVYSGLRSYLLCIYIMITYIVFMHLLYLDPPHGARNFDLGALSGTQKNQLNQRKQLIRIENEKYLATHPEIKGLISILLRQILQVRPHTRIQQFVGELYNEPRHRIISQLLNYWQDNALNNSIRAIHISTH